MYYIDAYKSTTPHHSICLTFKFSTFILSFRLVMEVRRKMDDLYSLFFFSSLREMNRHKREVRKQRRKTLGVCTTC